MPPSSQYPEFRFLGTLALITKDEGGQKVPYFRAIASSTVRDSHGDEFTDMAINKMADVANNTPMTLFLNHSYQVPEDVFGTSTGAAVIARNDGGVLVKDLDIEGRVNTANPRAMETVATLAAGIRLGVSIGARVKNYHPRDEKDPMGGWIIDDVELKEASIVGLPSNPRTWITYATKAISRFERERVKEAIPMDEDPEDDEFEMSPEGVVIEVEPDETVETIEAVEEATDDDAAKAVSVDELLGITASVATADEEPEDEEEVEPVEDADDETQESPSDGTLEGVTASETPELVLSQALASSVDAVSIDVLKSALQIATDEITKRDEAIDQLTQERDAALATLTTATAIVEKIASTPLGRKATFSGVVDDYRTRVGGVYNQEFLKFLKG